MSSEPLTPEEIAEMRVWHPEYPDGCENLDESAGLTNPCTSAAAWSAHWCLLCTIRRLLESHEALQEEGDHMLRALHVLLDAPSERRRRAQASALRNTEGYTPADPGPGIPVPPPGPAGDVPISRK